MDPRNVTFDHAAAKLVFLVGCMDTARTTFIGMGTAFPVADGIAITARHVLEEIWKEFDASNRAYGTREVMWANDFEIVVVQWSGSPSAAFARRVLSSSDAPSTDISFLNVSESALDGVVQLAWPENIVLDFRPPSKGEVVAAFGYPGTETRRVEGDVVVFETLPQIAAGEVIEIYPDGRDVTLLPFPSFRINTQFDGGLSGGPILNSEGHCCGIVSTGGTGHLAGAAYGALLWPSLATRLSAEGAPIGQLCNAGVIASKNLESFSGKKIDFIHHQSDVFRERRPKAKLVDL